MSSGSVYVTVPKTNRYVTVQIVDENHETRPMIYGSGKHKITAKTDYMNYVGAAGGWGGAMVEDNIYQTSQYFSADACYETTFVDPEAKYFWSATVYNGDGRMFNDKANISSEMNPVKNADGTYTLRFGCDGQPNNIPIVEGNSTGKFNVLMRHYGPSEQVRNGEDGYDATKLIHRVK
jgi:hypothetical protein